MQIQQRHKQIIEDLKNCALSTGRTSGIRKKLWKSQAKFLQSEGIVLSNPKATKRVGEAEYEIDFSKPVPGTLSEELFNAASAKAESYVKRPYEID